MQTGLEKMRDKIMESNKWEHLHSVDQEFGDVIDIWYNDNIFVKCYMYYEKDMDQELYLTKMTFIDMDGDSDEESCDNKGGED